MTFPWTNFITAGSTLFAALGATSLTGFLNSLAERRRASNEHHSKRAEVRAEAYSAFLRVAHADARLLGRAILQFTAGTPDRVKVDEIMSAISDIVDQFNAALARVQIVGSKSAAQAQLSVARAARTLGARCSNAYLTGSEFDSEAAAIELGELSQAIDIFAISCREELDEPRLLRRQLGAVINVSIVF